MTPLPSRESEPERRKRYLEAYYRDHPDSGVDYRGVEGFEYDAETHTVSMPNLEYVNHFWPEPTPEQTDAYVETVKRVHQRLKEDSDASR